MADTLHINTPLLKSKNMCNQEVLLKMEALQPSGSFKIRGVGHICQRAKQNGVTSAVIPSGGNAGIAAAIAGVELGIDVTVVVPESTSEESKSLITSKGANLVVFGQSFDDAAERAREIASAESSRFIHPFDDPEMWEGNATLIDEVVAAGESFDCVVTGVGGGGLMLGVKEGLDRNGLSDCPIISVETDGADSLYQSVQAGSRITLPAITSVATCLGARQVAESTFAAAQSGRVISIKVSDQSAVKAISTFLADQRVLVEAACGAVIASLSEHPDFFAQFKRPLVVVCGGAGISLKKLSVMQKQIELAGKSKIDLVDEF